jgi:hypothetical protein
MKGYTFFLAAAFLLTTTGAALAQNNLQSAKQRVEAITNARHRAGQYEHTGRVHWPVYRPFQISHSHVANNSAAFTAKLFRCLDHGPSTRTVSGAVEQSTVNASKSGQK